MAILDNSKENKQFEKNGSNNNNSNRFNNQNFTNSNQNNNHQYESSNFQPKTTYVRVLQDNNFDNNRGYSRGNQRNNRGRSSYYSNTGYYIQTGNVPYIHTPAPLNQNIPEQFLQPQSFQNLPRIFQNTNNIPDTRIPPPHYQVNNSNLNNASVNQMQQFTLPLIAQLAITQLYLTNRMIYLTDRMIYLTGRTVFVIDRADYLIALPAV